MPPKGQELDDHYFGVIRQRIGAFMKDVNKELWKLGVPAKTQHNEVAPGQHELAPIYEKCNVASDHNQIIMETLKRVAEQHGLQCLLHEKPFAGVNGSGKHNSSAASSVRWTVMRIFSGNPLLMWEMIIVWVLTRPACHHFRILRRTAGRCASSAGQYGSRSSQLKGRPSSHRCKDPSRGFQGCHRPEPYFTLFAFTGNKFEFRMVGSRDSVAECNVVLNTIVAEAFSDACDILEKAEDFDLAVHDLIKEYATLHQRIVFNGNGYSEEWVKEAERRGLPNIQSMVDAIPALVTEESVRMFEKFGVFTKAELNSRAEIQYEGYAKAINIEARAMIDIASKHIIPAVMRYAKNLAETANEIREAGADDSVPVEILKRLTALLSEARKALLVLKDVTRTASSLEAGEKQATIIMMKSAQRWQPFVFQWMSWR